MASRKYESLRAKKNESIKGINEDLQKMKQVSEESMRVSKIAGNASIIIADLDKQFAQATKLDGVDISFLLFAIALQCIRQYLITPFAERQNDKDSAKDAHKEEKETFRKGYGDSQTPGGSKRYYASLGDIITKGVPYDTQFGSGDFDLHLSGNAHRFRTLGHDPLFGWVFGTANIMTNTLTTWSFHSYHVKLAPMTNGAKKAKIVQKADTSLMFEKVIDRTKQEPQVLAAAIIKQRLHLKSDMFSIAGLPIPGVMTLSPEIAQVLAEHGIDIGNLLTVGAQATYSAFINTLIAIIHGLFYEESFGSRRLYDIRTRKILSYSNIIASSSNLIGVAIAEAIGVSTKNEKLTKDALRYLDIGGMAVTMYRIVSDKKFIQQIKQEFLEQEFYNLVMGKE